MTTPADTIRATATAYYREYGQWVETNEQETLVDQLRRQVKPHGDTKEFECRFTDILDVLERQHQAKDTNSWLPDGDRVHDLNLIEQELTAAIDRAA